MAGYYSLPLFFRQLLRWRGGGAPFYFIRLHTTEGVDSACALLCHCVYKITKKISQIQIISNLIFILTIENNYFFTISF